MKCGGVELHEVGLTQRGGDGDIGLDHILEGGRGG